MTTPAPIIIVIIVITNYHHHHRCCHNHNYYDHHLGRPRGLTFTWWGCCGLCSWYKPAELAHSFLFCSCVYFCLHSPFNWFYSKTHTRLKERFYIGRNGTKRSNFRGSPLFQATYKRKTEKQTINSTYLVSVRCSEAGGRKRAYIFYSINSPNNPPLPHSVLPVLFLPYWPFQLYISLSKSSSALI